MTSLRKYIHAASLAFALATVAAMSASCKDKGEESAKWIPPDFTSAEGRDALSYVSRFVEISPRDSGTVGCARAAQWIAQELRKIGLKPTADTWFEKNPNGKTQFSNIYADIPGTEGRDIVIIASHFDTKSGIENFVGANDGGSSVGLVLQLAKMLKDAPPLKYTLRFAFFDGEECVNSYQMNYDGLHGSIRMAQALREEYNRGHVAAIVLDMIGDKDLAISVPRNVTPWLATDALNASMKTGYNKLRIATDLIIDDHWPFIANGFFSIVLIDFDYGSAPGKNNYWHTDQDTIDKLSPESLRKTGLIVLDMLARINEKGMK